MVGITRSKVTLLRILHYTHTQLNRTPLNGRMKGSGVNHNHPKNSDPTQCEGFSGPDPGSRILRGPTPRKLATMKVSGTKPLRVLVINLKGKKATPRVSPYSNEEQIRRNSLD